MTVLRTASGSEIHLLGPTRYVRNGKEHECLAWGAVAPISPGSPPNSGAVVLGMPSVLDTPFGRHETLVPVRIFLGTVMPGMPLAFLRAKDGSFEVICSTPVVEIADGESGGTEQEKQAGPLPEDILKKLL